LPYTAFACARAESLVSRALSTRPPPGAPAPTRRASLPVRPRWHGPEVSCAKEARGAESRHARADCQGYSARGVPPSRHGQKARRGYHAHRHVPRRDHWLFRKMAEFVIPKETIIFQSKKKIKNEKGYFTLRRHKGASGSKAMVAGATGIWMRVVMVAVMWVAATAEQAVPSATGARRHGVRRALFVEQAALLSRSPSRESLLCTEDLQGPWRRKDAALRLQQQPAATGVRRHASTLVFVEQHDLASALALPEEPHGVCRLKESVSERRRHLQGFNDEYGDETTMPYIHFVMDALEREKQSLQLRPDGVNMFLLSRRAWVKQGHPRGGVQEERDSAALLNAWAP
jgi:hypothetical protein